MKTIIIFFLLSLQFTVFASTYRLKCDDVNAEIAYKTEPYCSMYNQTITSENHCELAQKDLNWKIYDGECWLYPELSKEKKEQIYVALEKLFRPTKDDDSIGGTQAREKIYVVLMHYVEREIPKEYAKGKDNANLQRMAAMHYAMNLFTTDRHFKFRSY